MANVEKYNMMQALAIITHCERTAPTHSNEKLDPARTQENYSLWPPGQPDKMIMDTGVPGQSSGKYAYRRLRKRLSEVSYLHRDDVNVLCSWCIHLGVDVLPGYENQQDFFKACVRYVAGLYGEENIVYAWVHMDEDTPHIHIGFVPIVRKPLKLRKNASEATKAAYEAAVAAGKTVLERVDADKLISLRHLQGWHPFFSRYMASELGYDPGVHTGITEALGGNLTVRQLKKKAPGWAETRRKQTNAFHAARKAGRVGERPRLDDRITLAGPKVQQGRGEGRKPSLDNLIKGAKSRSGK